MEKNFSDSQQEDDEYDLATKEFQIYKQGKKRISDLQARKETNSKAEFGMCSYSSETYVNVLNELEISTNAQNEKESDILNKEATNG